MSLQVQVMVPKPTGFFEQNGQYTFARQECSLMVPGDSVPTRVVMDIYTPKGGDPQWKDAGRYTADLIAKPGPYGKGLIFEVNFRNMVRTSDLSQTAPAPVQKAA